jgi:hypothetical protein
MSAEQSVTKAVLRKILDPAPGTALARARDYGIDLTFVAQAVASTPQERLERAVRAQDMARTLEEMRRNAKRVP